MRFRLCGGLEAPDFLLAEVAILSRISAVRTKVAAAQIIKQIVGGDLDIDKATKLGDDLSGSDVKAALAALRFILRSAAKYDVAEGTLTNELQQMGLPATNCSSVVRVYQQHATALRDALGRQSLQLSRLDSARDVDWRVDCVLDSREMSGVDTPTVQLNLPINGGRSAAFEVGADKFRVLFNELKAARSIMKNVEA